MINAKRIKMERVKKELNRRVRIWSGEYSTYWRPYGNGYTVKAKEAWELPLLDAYVQTDHCGPEKQIFFERI